MIISLLINTEINAYEKISNKIKPDDFKSDMNKKITSILYEHFEKGNSNTNILDLFSEQELIDHITSIMADDFEITNNEKAIDDLLKLYKKEKMSDEKNNIIKMLEQQNLEKEERAKLEKDLSSLIIEIAKIK